MIHHCTNTFNGSPERFDTNYDTNAYNKILGIVIPYSGRTNMGNQGARH